MLVCASHSPLMLVDMPRSAPDSQDFLVHAEEVRARVERFAPELVVVFGPDHFNGFFFDLMPVFCVGAAAESTEDWQLPKTELNVPSALIKASDLIGVTEKAKGQLRIQDALQLAEKVGFPSWVEVDVKKMSGTFKGAPDRSEFAQDINESLVVELYSK